MANNIPAGTTQFLIATSDQTYVLHAGDTRSATGTDSAIVVDGVADNDRLNILGAAEQTDMATWSVQISGDAMTVDVGKSGSILGNGGIEFNGDHSTLVNAGSITSTDDFANAIYYEGADMSITNTGTVTASSLNGTAIFGAGGDDAVIDNDGKLEANFGIRANGARTTIDLGVHSVINATGIGIAASGDVTDKISIRNLGHITGIGDVAAIQLDQSNDKVVNHGTISGDIELGAGDDVFDNRGGSVDQAIQGGQGDDTLITDKASVTLAENTDGGFDTVESTATYTLSDNVERLLLIGKGNIDGTGTSLDDQLIGNSGKNHLTGLAGADRLNGGKGDDLLTGGADGDTFVFRTGNGRDTITDFSHAEGDKVDLSGWGAITSFHDVKQHWSEDSGNLVITVGHDQLVFENTTKADLHQGDFTFV